jgi:hypothetical protein
MRSFHLVLGLAVLFCCTYPADAGVIVKRARQKTTVVKKTVKKVAAPCINGRCR